MKKQLIIFNNESKISGCARNAIYLSNIERGNIERDEWRDCEILDELMPDSCSETSPKTYQIK